MLFVIPAGSVLGRVHSCLDAEAGTCRHEVLLLAHRLSNSEFKFDQTAAGFRIFFEDVSMDGYEYSATHVLRSKVAALSPTSLARHALA